MPTVRHPPASRILRDVGRRICDARVAAGLTQEEAAHRAKTDPKHWQRLEKGLINVPLKRLIRIARVLNVPFWKLMTPPKGRAPRTHRGRPPNTPSRRGAGT